MEYPNECPFCQAAPGERCRTLKTGRVTDTHQARIRRQTNYQPPEQYRQDFAQPWEVSDVQRAFPAGVVGKFLPPRSWFTEDEVPREWGEFVNAIFAAAAKDIALIPKEDVDPAKAWDHATMILGSYEPKHEHKIEGVAWLLWRWFELGEYVYVPTGKRVTL